MPSSKAISAGMPLSRLETMRWIGDIPAHGARLAPDAPALIWADNGRETSYAELDRGANAFAALLAEQGFAQGDRLAYLGRNNDLFFVVMFGAIRAGVVLVPINWRLTPTEIAYQLRDSGAKWLLVDDGLRAAAQAAVDALPVAPGIQVIESPDGGEDLRRLLERHAGAPATEASHDRDLTVLQMYTSGTTGRPKGVLVSHYALSVARHSELISPDWSDWPEGGLCLSAMPNFHIGGPSWVLMGLVRLGTMVITGDPSPANMLALIGRYRVQRVFSVATVIRAIVDDIKARDVAPPDTLQGIYYGAMPMDETLLRETMALFDCRLGQFFGMTELTGTATFLPPDQHDPDRPQRLKSVGRPIAGMTLEIRGPAGDLLEVGQHGEIWIKAPTMMQGYWNLPEATASAIVDGWYATGDGGYLDEDGFLYLTDRIKDMIVTGGENVYPAEIEAALLAHPAVLSAAVIGVPDPRWGERVVAVVELRSGSTATEDDLIAHARGRIAAYKCPKAIYFDDLPRTASGKIQRGTLKSRMLDGLPAQVKR